MFPDSIPIIDFAPFVSEEDEAAKQTVARALYHACQSIGFLYLENHGIPAKLVNSMFAKTQQFFDLPLETKHQVARANTTNCGYVGWQAERLNPRRPGDLKEAFNVGKKTIWPAGQPAFRQSVWALYQYCTTFVTPALLQAFAIALNLPERFFNDKHGNNTFLRLLHYPPLAKTIQPHQIRAGEHTDYGSFTLLFQQQEGGLEVRTRAGEWMAAPNIPGTVLMNVGDAMQRWTNDQLCSTPHRVVNPSGEQALRSRYSAALFCDPNPTVEIACLESCHSPDKPPRYPPILAGDYLQSRFKTTYGS